MIAPIDTLTHVELIWLEKQIEHWIRFGRDVAEQIVDRRQRILSFAPGSIFAFVRWAGNDYGTVVSRIDILRQVDGLFSELAHWGGNLNATALLAVSKPAIAWVFGEYTLKQLAQQRGDTKTDCAMVRLRIG